MARIAFLLVSILLLSSCLKEDELKKPFVSYLPQQLNDGWQISNPEAENMDAKGLTKVYEDFHSNDLWQVRSVLVFRNGKLVAESYTKDNSDMITPRAGWSETKQVVGLLTGIALEQKLIKDINDPISDYLPEVEKFQDKKNITIENLLTMRSGINYNNDELSGQSDDILRQLHDKVVDFILGRPMANIPGENAHYKDCDPQLVSAIIQGKCGKPTSQWAKEVLFDKLEIKNLVWNRYKDGITLGGFGILTTPRELAKIGQCVLDSGQWKGTTIVNKAWIKQMTTVRIQDMYGYQFGYLWWKDVNRKMTMMCGHGGQYVCILPEKNLVVVMTAEVNTQSDAQFRFDDAFKWVDRIAELTN